MDLDKIFELDIDKSTLHTLVILKEISDSIITLNAQLLLLIAEQNHLLEISKAISPKNVGLTIERDRSAFFKWSEAGERYHAQAMALTDIIAETAIQRDELLQIITKRAANVDLPDLESKSPEEVVDWLSDMEM